MDSGQVKPGENAREAYIHMLQTMTRITPPIAIGIASVHSTPQRLLAALRQQGPLALEDVLKVANRDGALTDRRVGPAISRRIFKVFTAMDPGSFDV